jgi:hypothetical protein
MLLQYLKQKFPWKKLNNSTIGEVSTAAYIAIAIYIMASTT